MQHARNEQDHQQDHQQDHDQQGHQRDHDQQDHGQDHLRDEHEHVEVWKPCPGYTATHAVSDLGRVKSVDRTVSTSRGPRKVKGEVLTPDRSRPDGYARVNLHVNGKSTPKTVHGLIARAFHGPPPGPVGSKREEYTVDHRDGDKANNRAENLEWVTSEENRRRAVERGSIPRGSAHPRSKLTEDDVRLMRELHAEGSHTHGALAERFGISRSQVGQIVRREAWKHVE